MDTYTAFQVELAIRMALQIYQEESYVTWANKWLDGSDRTGTAAYAADSATIRAAAYAADYAAIKAAAYAAAYAAYVAADAAAAYTAAYTADYAANSIRRSIELGAKLELVVKFL